MNLKRKLCTLNTLAKLRFTDYLDKLESWLSIGNANCGMENIADEYLLRKKIDTTSCLKASLHLIVNAMNIST